MDREIFAHYSGSEEFFQNKEGVRRDLEYGFGPYEYLLGALSSCFYYTAKDLLDSEGVEVKAIDIHAIGTKRDEAPTTLKRTALDVTVTGTSDKDKAKELLEEASRRCSIFQTISKVSEMALSVRFIG